MTASVKCHHPDIGVSLQPVVSPNNKIVMMLQGASCNICKAKLRFVGLEVSKMASDEIPTMSRDGNAISLPIIEAA